MNDILQKGYARVASEVQPYSKTWYIPHHDIYHPSKLGKIWVVFDCSAEFNGRSVNKELLSGSDLTNQLASILIRFCQEQVAVIGDIESMFYQVWDSEERRSLLRFYGGKMGISITQQFIMKWVGMFLVGFHHPVAVIISNCSNLLSKLKTNRAQIKRLLQHHGRCLLRTY